MIKLDNITKKIKNTTVLKDISYTFTEGKIYGLYGRNGSGKTMLLRSISGLIVPTEGSIFIDDKQLHKDISFPSSLGLIIESMELLPQYDAFTNLKILSKIKNVANDEDIITALDRVGLTSSINLKVKKYSLGMKQRLNIAQAIFEKPNIILLDEPTNAIDESGVQQVYKLLQEEKERGAIIIIASHNKDDINCLCDHILKIDKGCIIDG